jgi:hypothetical protein
MRGDILRSRIRQRRAHIELLRKTMAAAPAHKDMRPVELEIAALEGDIDDAERKLAKIAKAGWKP